MVHTRTGDFAPDVPKSSDSHARVAATGPRGSAPELPPPPPPPHPPLVSLEQLLAMQNELMWVLTENLVHCGGHQPHHQLVMDSSNTILLVTHPLTFARAADPFEVDNWLRTVPSSRRLCTWASSFVRPPVLGRLTSPPLFRMATRCYGLSSVRPSADTTSLRA
jgi:hypothetical protein